MAGSWVVTEQRPGLDLLTSWSGQVQDGELECMSTWLSWEFVSFFP
jgi:hypothetical protein